MSKKINDQLKQSDSEGKKYIISQQEFNFLNSMDTIGYSFNHYMNQLKGEFTKMIAFRLGYGAETDLEFSIDLKDPKRELTIKPMPIPEEDKKL